MSEYYKFKCKYTEKYFSSYEWQYECMNDHCELEGSGINCDTEKEDTEVDWIFYIINKNIIEQYKDK